MALQKQVITLDFGYGGLDQKSDEKRVLPVRFTELTDVRFNKIGRLDRRPGHAALGAISQTVSKIILADDSMIAVSEHNGNTSALALRVSSNGSVTTTGLAPPRMPINELIADPTGTQRSFGTPNAIGTASGGWSRADSANYFLIVYTNGDSSGQFYGEMYDKATGNFFKTAGGGAGIRPRVWAHPDGRDQFLIGYNTSTTTTISFQTVSDTTGAFTVVGQPAEATVEQGEWDAWVCADNTQSTSAIIFVAYAKLASGIKIRTSPWPDSLGAGATLSTTTIAPTSGNVTRVSVFNAHNWSVSTANANARVAWFETVAGIRTMTFNHSLTTVLPNNAVTTDTTVPNFITGVTHSGAGTSFNTWLAAEYDGAANYDKKIVGYLINTSNTATGVFVNPPLKGLCLNSKMMAANNEATAYFWTAYSSTLQNTMFLTAFNFGDFSSYAAHPARMFHTYGWGPISRTDSGLPNMYSSGAEIIAPAMALRRSTLLGFQQDQWAMYGLRINKSSTVGWLTAEIRDEAVLSGGFSSYINGAGGPLPAAPQLYPQIVSVSATTSGGSMALGTYAVSGIFEYTDEMGRIRRSAPATPVTFALTGTQNALVLTVEAYRLLDNLGDNNRLKFVPFRTLVNESQVYYRTVSITATPSVPSTHILVTNLNDNDATVAANEPLYTTGGVFEDWQPDSPIALASNGRRCLAVSGRQPTFVMESKPITDKMGVAFFEDVGRSISPNGSRIYALASYLDKWFAFKSTAIFVAQGDGADVTGQNDTLSEFQPMSDGLGTTQPRSVISTSEGVVFNSQKGFFVIGGDLNATYIGDAVEDYTSPVVESAYDDTNDCVYFVLADGTCLVLTWFITAKGVEPRWSVDTIVAANSIATLNGVRYFAPKAISGLPSSIYKETPGTFIDANVSTTAVPAMTATTAWTAMGQVQGFGRIWKALCLGTFPPAQLSTTITVQIGYDYASTYAETHTIASTAFQQNGNNCQFEIRPARQKCEAIRFRITQGAPASGTAQGLFLNQIQLVVGVKANENKIPATSRM